MKTSGYLLLLCILLLSVSGPAQTLRHERPAPRQEHHLRGFPVNAVQAEAESTFDPAAPGYWNYDSSYFYQWLEPSAEWYLWEKYYITLNIAGYQTQGLYLVYDSVAGTWDNSTRYVTNYDASNKIVSRQGQAWNTATNSWVDFSYSHYNANSYPDESFYRTFNRITNEFTSGNRSLYVYDGAGNVTQQTNQVWDTGTEDWLNALRSEITYSASNKQLSNIQYAWNSLASDWKNFLKLDYSYDASDFLTGIVQYTWEPSVTDWKNDFRTTYSNNTNGDPVTELTEAWDDGASDWKPYIYEEMQYNPYYQLTQDFIQYWNTVLGNWENAQWSEYGYWPNKSKATEATKEWNPTNSTWIETHGAIYDTSGNPLEYYYKYLDYLTYNFSSGYKYIYEYNEDQRPVLALGQDLNTTLNIWIDSERRLTSYDPAGNNVLELDQVWDGAWKDQFKMVHYFSEQLGVTGPDLVSVYCLFANPLTKGQEIRCPGLEPFGNYSVLVYSVNGQLVFNKEITASQPVVIPATVSPGVCILEIRNQGRTIATGKVVITD